MAPPYNKRPPRPSEAPPVRAPKPDLEDAGFAPGEVLDADDPRPQHVPQYPVQRGARPNARFVPTKLYALEDRELDPRFDKSISKSISRPGETPAFLYVERGPGTGQLVPLPQGAMIIGRSSTADFRLQHPSISRRHVQLTRNGDHFFIKDLQSQNGTFVNKLRLSREVELFPGDVIAMGTAVLKLRGHAEPSLSGASESTGTPRWAKSGLVRGLIFAGAVGLGLLLVSLLSSSKPEPAPTSPKPEAAAAPLTPPPAPAPAPAVSPPATAPASAAKAVPSRAHLRHASAHASRAVHAAAASHHAAASEGAGTESLAVRAKYEEGDLSGAIELARRLHSPMLAKLTRFRSAYESATRAAAAHPDDTAADKLEQAIQLDEEIAEGWGSFNAELRSQLTAINSRTVSAKPRTGTRDNSKKAAIDAAFGE